MKQRDKLEAPCPGCVMYEIYGTEACLGCAGLK